MRNYNKNFRSKMFFAVLSVGLFFMLSSTASARGLVPCGGTGEDACTLCHLVVGVSGIMNYIYKIIFATSIAIFAVAGVFYTVSAGDSGMIEMAKKAMKNAVIGIVVIFGAWLIVNYSLRLLGAKTNLGIEGAGGWDKFQCTGTVGASGLTGTTPSTGGVSVVAGGATCSRANDIKSGQSVCSGGCPSNISNCMNKIRNEHPEYISLIQKYANGKDKLVLAIMAKESCGNKDAVNSSTGACGLMQVLPAISNCSDPETNIKKGIDILNGKMNSVSVGGYGGGITQQNLALAAYNCCKEENPNSASSSCNTAEGWPYLPKWACPLDPGTGTYNMCTVRDYSCGISACAS